MEVLKLRKIILFMILILTFALTSCKKVVKVSVLGDRVLYIGETKEFIINISNNYQAIKIKSDDEKVVKITNISDLSFSVTGIGLGDVIIKVTIDSHIEEVKLKVITHEDDKLIEEVMNAMTIEEKIGQMFMVGFTGTTIPTSSIDKYKFGNFIYMLSNTENANALLNLTTNLQNKMINNLKIPAFISIDQEGGMVEKFLSDSTHFIGNMGLSATQDPNNAYLVGSKVGQELRNYGMTINFAPVIDVNNNPNNPIIGVRSYSDNPEVVSEYGNNMIKGLSENVMACPKHFPGHGDTQTDTHYGLPIITHSLERLYEVELKPYINAIEKGLDAIMTTHIIFEAIDKNQPATLSRRVLTELLREELGFEGLIITDGMNMGAIKSNYGYAQAGVMAVLAGADILLFSESTSSSVEAYNGILAALKNGDISLEVIDKAVHRILTKKRKFNLFEDYLPKGNDLDLSLHQQLNEDLSKQSLTVVKGENKGLDKNKSTLIISPVGSRYNLDSTLTGDKNSLAYIAKKGLTEKGFKSVDYLVVASNFSIDTIIYKAKNYEQIVIAFENVNSNQANLVKELYRINNDIVAISLNRPYDINSYEMVKNYICMYEYTPTSVQTIIKFLNNEFKATGKLPVALK
jgi:beta-N-acetylhexosaminidase